MDPVAPNPQQRLNSIFARAMGLAWPLQVAVVAGWIAARPLEADAVEQHLDGSSSRASLAA